MSRTSAAVAAEPARQPRAQPAPRPPQRRTPHRRRQRLRHRPPTRRAARRRPVDAAVPAPATKPRAIVPAKTTSALKTWFLTGLLVLVPLGITLWVLSLVIGTMDQSLALLPLAWQPDRIFGMRIPGLGAILTLLFILLVGVLTHNLIGQRLVRWWEVLLGHIPVVGPIYTSVKQVSDTLPSS